ncbi:MAG: chromate transporter [Clostridia bacterium]|nr:chromate transporter [Clostridia bacterium]
MKKLKDVLGLFFSMMKIGLFTFGGGYAMIHLLDNEFVTRKGWLERDEFTDLVVIAESTPGPIAINCATYIGYRRQGVFGAAAATIAMCIPSFVIIYLISLFFNQFLAISWVASAFRGIQICVIFLILSAGFKMLKKMKKTPFSLAVMIMTLVSMITLSLLAISFSTIFYILIFGSIGLLIYAIGYFKGHGEGKK